MTALQGAMESTAPVSRLHLRQSFELADFPAPARREEEWRFTPLRSSAKGPHPASGGWLSATCPAAHLVYVLLAVPAPGRSLRAPVVDETVPMPPK